MTKKNVQNVSLKSHTLKSSMGIFPIGNGWILAYENPYGFSGEIIKEHYDKTDDDIADMLYSIKENCLNHFNSKHNNYNIIIKKVKVKE
jgi:hypothetical protein